MNYNQNVVDIFHDICATIVSVGMSYQANSYYGRISIQTSKSHLLTMIMHHYKVGGRKKTSIITGYTRIQRKYPHSDCGSMDKTHTTSSKTTYQHSEGS